MSDKENDQTQIIDSLKKQVTKDNENDKTQIIDSLKKQLSKGQENDQTQIIDSLKKQVTTNKENDQTQIIDSLKKQVSKGQENDQTQVVGSLKKQVLNALKKDVGITLSEQGDQEQHAKAVLLHTDKSTLDPLYELSKTTSDQTEAINDLSQNQGDVTRIAPPRKKVELDEQHSKTEIFRVDKTVVAPLRIQPNSNDDKTRVKPRVPSSIDSNATVFKPSVIVDEKTRIPPLSPEKNDPMVSSGQFLASEIAVGVHGKLKERFVLEDVIGTGGMGVVYKAIDLLKVEAKDRDPFVAIKVLNEEFKTHPEAFISLQRESRKCQRIAHPNIVNVFDFDRDGDTVFMTMEYMDGDSLDKLIAKYKLTGLPTDYAWAIIKDMSLALSYAHAEKIIHSDFKPGNVFVTKRGLAKVFDFGIARAVAKVDHHDDNPQDQTVFDAGNLGALTPAYASLEMLEGEEPDVRDDIYALGCVSYELFMGVHPYNKVPANKALKKNLKPKRIENITKYQWKAIEQAIAFKREDRIATVDEFTEAVGPRKKGSYKLAIFLVFLFSAITASYFLFFQEKVVDPYSEFDIRNELELELKIGLYRENLSGLLDRPTFTEPWEDAVWKKVSDLLILTKGGTDWLSGEKSKAYNLYFKELSLAIVKRKFTRAQYLIKNARRYTDSEEELDLKLKEIDLIIKRTASQNEAKTKQAKIKAALAEKNRWNKQQNANRQKIKNAKKLKLQQVQQSKLNESTAFDATLSAANEILNKCAQRISMREFGGKILALKKIDKTRFTKEESKLVRSLSFCITYTAKVFPKKARDIKKQGLRIFKSNKILAAIVIEDLDTCNSSLAGLGSRGSRATCKDHIKGIKYSPVLVVIPKKKGIKSFAIGKYEVSTEEFNAFCKSGSNCQSLTLGSNRFPVSNVNIKLIQSYLKWLSKSTSKKYRLPTKAEWLYASKSKHLKLDANRNCILKTRGIQKGGQLVKVNIGRQNGWGLVNYVGNVQELVYDKGRELVAVGGSYLQSMNECLVTASKSHNGFADKVTGFRVLRELK